MSTLPESNDRKRASSFDQCSTSLSTSSSYNTPCTVRLSATVAGLEFVISTPRVERFGWRCSRLYHHSIRPQRPLPNGSGPHLAVTPDEVEQRGRRTTEQLREIVGDLRRHAEAGGEIDHELHVGVGRVCAVGDHASSVGEQPPRLVGDRTTDRRGGHRGDLVVPVRGGTGEGVDGAAMCGGVRQHLDGGSGQVVGVDEGEGTVPGRLVDLVVVADVAAVRTGEVLHEERRPQHGPTHPRRPEILFDLPVRHRPVGAHQRQEDHVADAAPLHLGDERPDETLHIRQRRRAEQEHTVDTVERRMPRGFVGEVELHPTFATLLDRRVDRCSNDLAGPPQLLDEGTSDVAGGPGDQDGTHRIDTASAGRLTWSSSASGVHAVQRHELPGGRATASRVPNGRASSSSTTNSTSPWVTTYMQNSPSWVRTVGTSPAGPAASITSAPASPPVAAAIPVSRTRSPSTSQSDRAASAATWRTNRCPPKSRSGSTRAVGSSMSCSTSVSWTAGHPISITSRPGELLNTRCRISGGCTTASPASSRNGGPWSSYTRSTQPRRQKIIWNRIRW